MSQPLTFFEALGIFTLVAAINMIPLYIICALVNWFEKKRK